MTPQVTAITLLLGSFIGLLVLRLPIAFALGVSSLITAWFLGIPSLMIAQRMINGLNNFTFLAIPFFILAGQLMTEGGIAAKLVRLADVVVGRLRGGLAQVNVLASTLFSGISGSSVADVASVGSFLIPAMTQRGYKPGHSVAITISSAVQGVLIPPSQNMIYYALAASGLVSINKLFLAGYLPGLLLGSVLMLTCWVLAIKRGHPRGERYTWRQALYVIADSFIGLFTLVIIVGGIVGGIFTATESAAVATVYALLVTVFVYRSMTWERFIRVLRKSTETLAMVIAIIMTSSAFSFLLSYLKVPSLLSHFILGLSDNPRVILLYINILLLFLGLLMDMGILILLLTPILLPIAINIGVDPVHFGVIMVINLGVGLCTPPVGTSLIVGCSIARISIGEAVRDLWPFYAAMLIVLAVVTYVPEISLALPRLLG